MIQQRQRRHRRLSLAVCCIGAGVGLGLACGDDSGSTSSSVNSAQPANGGAGGSPSASVAAGSGGTTAGTGAAGSTGTAGGTGTTAGGNATGNGSADSSGAAAAGSAGSGATGSTGSTNSADAGVPSGDAGPAGALEDGQLLYVADTLNAGEIEEARAALPKLMNGDVRDFAQQMLDQHGAARDRLLQLAQAQSISPSDSDIADELRSKSQSNIQSLLGAAPSASDALYIELQVSEHVDALQLLDQLASAADAEPLVQELIAERSSVQTHLDRARALNDANP